MKPLSGIKVSIVAFQSGADISMVVQFVVRFYSAHPEAEEAVVIKKFTDDVQYAWESSPDGSLMVRADHGEPIS